MMRWSSLFGILVLSSFLVAACGGTAAAPTAAPKAAATAAMAKPTAAPAAPNPRPAGPAAEATRPMGIASAKPDEATKPAGEAKPAPGAAESAAKAPSSAPVGSTDATGGAAHPCYGCLPPTPVPVRDRRQFEPLRAGAVDDNVEFDQYLRYLEQSRGFEVLPVDVRERYLITVTDSNQRPVVNGLVTVYAGQSIVFTGRTYANGMTVFHPRANPQAAQAQSFTVTAEKDNHFASLETGRGGGSLQLALSGAAYRPQGARLDLVFLIDSTGSMGGEIRKIQATLGSIVSRISRLSAQPRVRFAGVTYRDRGDAYRATRFNFTEDQQAFQTWLNGLQAAGGGDYPEDLNLALHVTMSELDWDTGDAVRLVFLVADAPPHLDYQEPYRYTTEAQVAVTKGVKLYTIGASGLVPQGEYVFRQLAQQTLAQYLFITRGGDEQGGGGPVSATNIQSAENNLDDIVVRIVTKELTALG